MVRHLGSARTAPGRGPVAYLALVLILRLTGKRTLSKLNAFDLVVSVALGSTLATVILNADVSLSEGIVALTLLVALQYLVTWSSVRCRFIKRLARAEPTLIYRDGFLDAAMRSQRVTREEVRQAARTVACSDRRLKPHASFMAPLDHPTSDSSVAVRHGAAGSASVSSTNWHQSPPSAGSEASMAWLHPVDHETRAERSR